ISSARDLLRGQVGATFIYTSGCWVQGPTDGVADESTPAKPARAVSWRPAHEQAALEMARDGIRSVVVRPGIVYGGARGGIPAMFFGTALKHGAAQTVGAGENHWPLVHIDDLAELYVRLVERAPAGSVYYAADASRLTQREIAEAAAFGANYLLLYKQQDLPRDVEATVTNAGGSVVYQYPQIGVVIAKSDNASFRDNLLKDNRIENAAATERFATRLPDTQMDAEGPPPGDLPNAPATDTDSLSALQWDMRQIHTPEAHAITGGSPAVLVGDIDTGIDFHHPDLRQNIDVADSANCLSGAPVPGLAAQDDNGHGTHTAGTIAAASNGIGIVGVAPNVKIAGIKAGNADGFFFPEAVVCAFVWAATHHVDVTNHSYFADPWEYNCRNDPEQRAIWKAESRAIRYAEQNGVTVVAAEGNDADDTAHPTFDRTSPDDTTPEVRVITNACVIIPVEVPGVIGVTATGAFEQGTTTGQYPDHLKSFFSSFGVGVTDVTAPGGDSRYGRPPVAIPPAASRVLPTWP